jgi:hypothetical protein
MSFFAIVLYDQGFKQAMHIAVAISLKSFILGGIGV